MPSGSSWPPQESLPARQRAVVFEPSWQVEAAQVAADIKRFDEISVGLCWMMEYGAHVCPYMPDSPFLMARAVAPDGRHLRAFFTVNDSEDPAIRAWHVDVVEDDGVPAGDELPDEDG
jgi:hypothetical protein